MIDEICFELLNISGVRDLVYPVRVGGSGNTHSTHFISKRSTSYVQNFDPSVQYVFPAYGKNFSLDLTFSKDFIAPALVVQHYSGNSTWRSETHRSVGLSQCFYSGRINQDLNSRGVFSLCEGLVSTNQTTSNLLQLPDPPPPSQLITRKNPDTLWGRCMQLCARVHPSLYRCTPPAGVSSYR